MDKDLMSCLKFNDSLPFLFVGSGFSRRYLGTPDWKGLLEYFCNEIAPEDPFLFSKYVNRAKTKIYNEKLDASSDNILNSIIADFIEQDYNEIWYSSDRFSSKREIWKNDVVKGTTPFRLALAEFFSKATEGDHLLREELVKLSNISPNSIAGIITTNYDTLLESIFDFTTYIGQENLLFSSVQGVGEIYKIHGCATKPDSIVINSEDYSLLQEKSKYLAAKLLTIFVEHPIVFIGYSMSDEDIREILNNIAICLSPEQLESMKSRFIFVRRLSVESPENFTINFVTFQTASGKSFPMTEIRSKDYGIIYDALSANRTKYPVKWLRMLKENVYDLVATTTPSEKVKVMLPFDDMDKFDDVEFVIGVGVSKLAEAAYSSFKAEEIFHDIIFDDKKFDPDLLLSRTMPEHLSRTNGYMPLFKYISSAKKEIPSKVKQYIVHSVEDFYNNSIQKTRTTFYGETIEEIEEKFEYPGNIYYIVRLPYKNLDIESLGNYLSKNLSIHPEDIYTGSSHPYSSDLRRLIRIYDWMRYHKE